MKLARKERPELQSLIRRTTAPQLDVTRARIALMAHEGYGRHLLIKRVDDQDPTVVARLSELSRNCYGAAFRSHSGRWEPLPDYGTLDEMAQLVVTLLQSYLQPDNY